MRRNLVLMEGEFPGDEVRVAMATLEVNGNPFGLAYAARGDWADGLDVTAWARGARSDILYFVGCYASFDKRNQAVAPGLRQDLHGRRGQGRHPRQGGELLRRAAQKAGQRIPVPERGAREHRDHQGVRRQEGRHHLPALLQHPRRGLPRPRLRVRGASTTPPSWRG